MTTDEEPQGRQWVQWAGDSGLSFRDVVGPPWGEEMEEEAQERDGEVRVSSYIDDEGYAHETYRLEQIENDVGIEVSIIMKVRQFRQMMEEDPSDQDIPTGYAMFRELQRMLMTAGAESRKEVTDYIRSLRQYTYHIKKGHEDVNCPLEESEWPDGWMAANWGPPRMLREFRMPPRRRERRRNESSSSEEHDAGAMLEVDDRRNDNMVMDEPEPEITE